MDGWDGSAGRGRGAVTLLAGVLVLLAGSALLAVGVGAPWWETQTFTRISCRESDPTAKGGTVWHCSGESPAQVRANDAARREAERRSLHAHRDGVPAFRPAARTDLLFVSRRDEDPRTVVATLAPVGPRWIAHSSTLTVVSVTVQLVGLGLTAWGAHRLRPRHR
jgi:hypothetical protein